MELTDEALFDGYVYEIQEVQNETA